MDRLSADAELTATFENPETEKFIQFTGRTEGGVLLDLSLNSLSESERAAALKFFRSRGFDTPSDQDAAAESAIINIVLPDALTATQLTIDFFNEVHRYPAGFPLQIIEFN